MNCDEVKEGTALVVDDDPRNLKVLNTFLLSAGYHVLLAKDGHQCLESADLGQPDIILLDIVMLDMDGYETCRGLKSNPATAGIPVIFISALAETENIIQGFEIGGVDYITKPFRREEVLARVNAHVTIQRQKRDLLFCNRDLEEKIREKKEMAAALAKSEQRLNEAQILAGLGNWERDLNTGKSNWSDNQYRLFGYEPGEAAGGYDLFKKHVHPEDLDRVVTAVEDCIHKGEPHEIEYRYLHLSGEVRYAHEVGQIERDTADRPLRIHGILQDITEKKRRERELHSLHQRLDGILRYTPNIISALDADGRYLHINPAGQRFFGLPEERIVGVSCRDLMPPDAADTFMERIGAVLDTGKVLEVEDAFIHDARQRHFATTLFPIYDNEGLAAAVGGIAMDITERKKAEEERLQMERRVQTAQRLESLGILAGGIAHDFNNILMVVLGNLELAMDDLPEDHTVQRFLKESEKATQRAVHLVRQMLAYSGKGQFVVRPIDISDLVQKNARKFRTTLPGMTDLALHLETDLPTVEGDPLQLRQLLTNLILNAAEASENEGGGTVTITTGVRTCGSAELSETLPDLFLPSETPFERKQFLFIDIADEGCGMDAETRKRIFEPFFTTKFQGRGLGLPAALGIVRGHRGYIRVDSEPGRGSVFRVLLPVLT